MSSRSGPIRAMVRPRSLPSNDTSTSSSNVLHVSSTTSSRPPLLSKHSRHGSLESVTSSLSQRLTISSGRAGTVFTSTSQQQPLQQVMVKSSSTGHLASQSTTTTNTSQCLKDFCPPLNAARLKPIKHQTRNTIVSQYIPRHMLHNINTLRWKLMIIVKCVLNFQNPLGPPRENQL